MTRTFKRIIIIGLLMIAIAGCAVGCVVTSHGSSPLTGMRTASVNFALDHLGVKSTISNLLHEKAATISQQTGVPLSTLEQGINALAVEEWSVVDTPSKTTANVAGVYPVEVQNVPVSIIAYDNPSYVTLEAYGQSLTFSVPDSAQTITQYIPLLAYANQ